MFGPESSNRKIYEKAQPIVDAACSGHTAGLIMDGYSGTADDGLDMDMAMTNIENIALNMIRKQSRQDLLWEIDLFR